jgi:hypothetical protein
VALEIEELIKIILGIFVVIAVILGLYFFFKNKVFDFFKGLSIGSSAKSFMGLIQ